MEIVKVVGGLGVVSRQMCGQSTLLIARTKATSMFFQPLNERAARFTYVKLLAKVAGKLTDQKPIITIAAIR